MNSPFKLALTLLNTRQSKKGFTLVLCAAMGAILLLTSAAILTRATKDKTKVLSQTSKAQGIAFTEVALTQVRNFLNTYPYLATSDQDQWDNIVADTTPAHEKKKFLTCQSTTSEWATQQAQITDLSAGQTGAKWFFVDPNDPKKGLWSLKYYKYDSTKQQGIAFIDTVVNYDPAAGSSSEGLQQAPVRIAVDLGVKPSAVNPDENAPGLWIKHGDANKTNIDYKSVSAIEAATGSVNNTFAANVWMNCNVPQSSVDNLKVTAGYKAKKVPYDMPTPPAISNNAISIDTIEPITYPRSGDSRTSYVDVNKNNSYDTGDVPIYEYNVTGKSVPGKGIVSADMNGNNFATINTVVGGSRAIVTFNINHSLPSGTDIRHTAVSPAKPTDFRIFGRGPTGNYICLNGNNQIQAFILAPTYDAGVNGGANDVGGVKGSLWVQSYNKNTQCSSSTSNIVVQQTAKWSDLLGLDLMQITLPPQVGDVATYQNIDVTQEPAPGLTTIGALSLPASTSVIKPPLVLPPITAALTGGTETVAPSPSPSVSPSPLASVSPSPVCLQYNNGNGACVQWQ